MSNRNIAYRRLADLRPYPDNPKLHDLETLTASIRRFGFVAPVIVDETSGVLAAGHGRLDALTAMHAADPDAIPDGITVDRAGAWLVPVITGAAFASADDLAAYVLADNETTISGGWDETKLTSILARIGAVDGGYDGTGFDRDRLTLLLASARGSSTVADVKATLDAAGRALKEKPVRPVDLIFTQGTINTSALADPTPRLYCCIACRCGWMYGVQSGGSGGVCVASRTAIDHKLVFIDNEFKSYNHAEHVATVKQYRPKYTTVRDVMTREQCAEAGIAYYGLSQILEWADELSQYAENVIVIPKYDCIEEIPDRFMLGFSVPTSYGGTPLAIERFRGRRVHLLGGSFNRQLGAANILGDSLVSLDSNFVFRMARFGSIWRPDQQPISIYELGFRDTTAPFVPAFALSLGTFAAQFGKTGDAALAAMDGAPEESEEQWELTTAR